MDDGLSEKIDVHEDDSTLDVVRSLTRTLLSDDISSITAEEREVLQDLIDILISAREVTSGPSTPGSFPREKKIAFLARRLGVSATWFRFSAVNYMSAVVTPSDSLQAGLESDIMLLTDTECDVVRGMIRTLIRARSDER